VLNNTADPRASMNADLDLLLISVFCTAEISCPSGQETPAGA